MITTDTAILVPLRKPIVIVVRLKTLTKQQQT